MNSTNSKRIGIWIRVSTEDQVRGESPETHERRARLYAESKGWTVIEVYRLDAMSGKTVKEYPETKRMLEDIRTGHITALIFSKLARLARNTKELLEFADIFTQSSADLVSLAEAIDTSTPAGRLFYTMIAAMAQWEREEISARVSASVPIRAKMGKPIGGQAPFGYQWNDGKLVPDPKEAPVRKLIYELYRDHKRKKAVARILNERGYRTRNGSEFSDTTVSRLIEDPTAKGVRRANYTQSGDKNGAWKLKPESEWILIDVDPIIGEDLWDECNAILGSQREKGKRPTKPAVHLFSGIAHCGCGGKMYVTNSSPNKYVCGKCRNKIPIVDLEAVFHEQLTNFFFSPQEIASHLDAANQTIREKSDLLQTLEREQAKLQKEIDKLYTLYQENFIDKQGFGTKYRPLSERMQQLLDTIPAAQAEIDVLRISQLSHEEIISGAQGLYARWTSLPFEERRRIVETITERIEIGEDEVEISLYYAPPSIPRNGGGSSETGSGQKGPSSPSTPPQNAGKRATQLHDGVAFLPFVKHTCKSLIKKGFQGTPQTTGEHVLKKRLEEGLTQKELAARFGVDSFTVLNLERGHISTIPAVRMPAVIQFLGYNPEPEPVTVGDRLRWKRRSLGWTIEEAARRNSVDSSTWNTWEQQPNWPKYPRFRELLDEFFRAPLRELAAEMRRVRPSRSKRRSQV